MGEMLKPCCPYHDPNEIVPYAHLPKIVLPACRFDDPEYMEAVKRRLPHGVELVPYNNPLREST